MKTVFCVMVAAFAGMVTGTIVHANHLPAQWCFYIGIFNFVSGASFVLIADSKG